MHRAESFWLDYGYDSQGEVGSRFLCEGEAVWVAAGNKEDECDTGTLA